MCKKYINYFISRNLPIISLIFCMINAVIIVMVVYLENLNGASNVTEAITAIVGINEYYVVIGFLLTKIID